jgi:hypothetical protein
MIRVLGGGVKRRLFAAIVGMNESRGKDGKRAGRSLKGTALSGAGGWSWLVLSQSSQAAKAAKKL